MDKLTDTSVIAPALPDVARARAGVLLALVAFGIWALYPLYWKNLPHVGAVEIMVHRALWTAPICLAVLVYSRRLGELTAIFRRPRVALVLAASAGFISVNWTLYIWAILHDRVLEASMGYFLNPLCNILMGLLVFRERLRPWQWAAVGLAAAGVLFAGFGLSSFPWVAVILAVSFALYATLRKLVPVEAVAGLMAETLWAMPLALGYVIWLGMTGQGQFLNGSLTTDILLMGGGLATAIPLICYVGAARRLPISTLGMLFYLTPSGLFLLGVFLYREPVTAVDMATFGLIWAGLAIFTWERQNHARRLRETVV